METSTFIKKRLKKFHDNTSHIAIKYEIIEGYMGKFPEFHKIELIGSGVGFYNDDIYGLEIDIDNCVRETCDGFEVIYASSYDRVSNPIFELELKDNDDDQF